MVDSVFSIVQTKADTPWDTVKSAADNIAHGRYGGTHAELVDTVPVEDGMKHNFGIGKTPAIHTEWTLGKSVPPPPGVSLMPPHLLG